MKNCAILVNSCDAYSDLWPSFFHLLKLNWPNIEQMNVYLNTESTTECSLEIPVHLITTELNGKDLWGKRLINALSQIEEDYVVVLMDDFYLKSQVSEERIQKCIDAFDLDPSIAVFYLYNTFRKSFNNSEYEGFGVVPPKTNFRLNSAPAIWRKSALLKYTKQSDNPWAWEYFGTCRTNRTNDKFYCVIDKNRGIYDYAHAIYRGKWLAKDVLPVIKKYNLELDLDKRGIVEEGKPVEKRSLSWKLRFLTTGIRMVGFDAIKEVYRDVKSKRQ